MPVLSIKNIEKYEEDTILFPRFNLDVFKGQIAVIHSNLNVRKALLEMLIGKTSLNNGEISVNEILIGESTYLSFIGISFFEEGLYERLSVHDHFKFFKRLYHSKESIADLLNSMQLMTYKNIKVKKLSYSKKKRVQFARLLFQNPTLFIFEEPDLNVDEETKRIFLNTVINLQEREKSLLVLTGNMESAITIADDLYRLDEKGLARIEMDLDEEQLDVPLLDDQPIEFDKIPIKINDKIILFDPPEIDYIESYEGQSILHIKGESFPCVFTLTDLEERLRPFRFFRCHRSYIVNLQKVREVITWTRNSFNLILDNQEKSSIPLSKSRMAILKDMLGMK